MLLRINLFVVLLQVYSVLAHPFGEVKNHHQPSEHDSFTFELPGAKNRHSLAHSARSLDQYAGGFKERDSPVFQLHIGPSEHSFVQPRNLGSSPSSLNSIPSGAENNEISANNDYKYQNNNNNNVRDSYGNAVTPFTEIGGNKNLEPVGFFTDVNRDSGTGSKSISNGKYNFKVPSYASGIIDTVPHPDFSLLPPPPLSSGNFNYPGHKTQPAKIEFINQFKAEPEDINNPVLFAQKPTDGLVPPLFPDEQGQSFNVKVGTERTPIFDNRATRPHQSHSLHPTAPDFKGPHFSTVASQGNGGPTFQELPQETLPQNFNQGNVHQPKTFTQETKYTGGFGGVQPPIQSPSQLPQNNHPTGSLSRASHSPTISPVVYKQTEKPIIKYTGSFGGSPGVLGNQAPPTRSTTLAPHQGHVNKPYPRPTSSSSLSSPATSFGFQSQTPQDNANKYTGSFGGSSAGFGHPAPTTRIPTIQSQGSTTLAPHQGHVNKPYPPPTSSLSSTSFGFQSQTPQNNGNKFIGSFGGSPGVLGNQAPTSQAPQGSFGFQSQNQPSHQNHQNEGQHYTGGFGGGQGAVAPTSSTGAHWTLEIVPTPNSQANKYTGGFGGAPGVLGNQHKPTNQAVTQKPNQNSGGGKYTGGFGGAPGVLGNQQKPGYAVKPHGSFVIPQPTSSSPAHLTAVHQKQKPEGQKYTGGFGGPPGLLKPFDNTGSSQISHSG